MKNYIIIATSIVLLIALGYFIYSDLGGFGSDKATTTPNGGDEIVEYLPDVDPPSLDREFVVPDIYSDEIKANTMEQYNAIVSALKEDHTLRDEWLVLAILRNAIEDYEGAEEIWIYMTEVRPLDPVSFGNLGYAYTHNLVDYDKAESYLVKAVELNPTLTQNSQNLYDLYRFKLDDPEKAVQVLIEMGSVVSGEIFYPLRVGEHYRDLGNNAEAEKYFKIALDLAEDQDLTDIESYVRAELGKLQ